VPAVADTIVPLEQFHEPTQQLTSQITFDAVPVPDKNIRRRAEDTLAGAIVAVAGTVLGSQHIGAIAATGVDTVFTARRPRVAIISTGDELIAPGSPPEYGQIPDSNAPLIAATLRQLGAEPTHQLRIRDSAASLEHTIAQLEHTVDAMILTGGASVGAHDISNYVLTAWQHEDPAKAITFHEINMRPGKPQAFGLSPAGTPLWSLPGKPVTVLVSLHVFAAPGLATMQRQAPHPPAHRVYPPDSLSAPKDLNYYILATRQGDSVTALPSNSHLAVKMAQATGLIHVPAEVQSIEAQQIVDYISL